MNSAGAIVDPKGRWIKTLRLPAVLALITLFVLAGAIGPASASLHSAPPGAAPSSPAAAPSAPANPAPSNLVAAPISAAVSPPSAAAPSPQSSLNLPSNFRLPAPQVSSGSYPGSWGGSALPPGAITPSNLPAGWGGNTSSSNFNPKYCTGIWPGQEGLYSSSACYGHDEPGLDFYSPLAGSGGNVSWNITLPMDRSPTLNQSDLYVAIWFGLTLSDPYAWMDACFLELQFYPDSSWYAPGPSDAADTVAGQWVGEAVAWQIDTATGAENPCFISPLYTNGTWGPNFFNMTQGDSVQVTMSGWASDPYGENISIVDNTNGNQSFVNLYNRTGSYENLYSQSNRYILGQPNYPLDPAYSINGFPNALPWTPGGELPVAFAFETGHGGNPTVPSTNSYGGCSPGAPGSPDAPCPSYDPGSWQNDTAQPWEIAPPTFFNSGGSMTPAQVSFAQDIGAIGFIDNSTGSALPGDPCVNGLTPGAWCDYPWYSYSCSQQAFNFGATDWATTSDDFGTTNEYSYVSSTSSAGLSYYTLQNFSMPACGATTVTVGVGPASGGSVYFLNSSLDSMSNYTVVLGDYSLHALASSGMVFTNWTVTGSVSVGDSASPWTSLAVSGAGTVTANFAASAPLTSVKVIATGGGIEMVPGILLSRTTGTYVSSGTTLNLKAGIYSIIPVPAPGYNFTAWSVNSSSASVASTNLPYTWLIVGAGVPAVTLTAHFIATSVVAYIIVETYIGQGSVSFDSNPLTTYDYYQVPLGGYSLLAVPATGYQFVEWLTAGNVIATNLVDTTTYFVLQDQPSGYGGLFGAVFAPAVTVDVAPSTSGSVAIASLGYAPQPSGTQYYLSPGYYTLAAVPTSGEQFVDWTVSDATALYVLQPTVSVVSLLVNLTATITAHFTNVSPSTTVWFNDTPSTGGSIFFNYQSYSNGQSNATLGAGYYTAFVLPAPGWKFTSWSNTGSVLSTNLANVFYVNSTFGATGSLTAVYTAVQASISFAGHGTAAIGSTHLVSGMRMTTFNGAYALSITPPGNTTFIRWATQGGVSVTSPTSASTVINVSGPGTIFAIERPPTLALGPISTSPSPPEIELGDSFTASIPIVSGASPYASTWTLPPGCAARPGAISITCSPSIAGTFPVSVAITDAFGAVAMSPAQFVTIVPHFAVAQLTVSPSIEVTLNAHITLRANVTGGFSPFTFSFSGVPGCVGTSSSGMLACTPSAAGTFTVTVTATDGRGVIENRSTAIVVNPALAIQLAVNAAQVTVGASVVFSASPSGGTAPYRYAYFGLPAGCNATANPTRFTCSPSAAGAYNVSLLASDSGGGSASSYVLLGVNPTPTLLSFIVSSPSVTAGQTAAFAAIVLGGTSPFTYSYSGLPIDCPSENSSTLVCTSQVVGNYNVEVVAIDADGSTVDGTTPFNVTSAGSSASGSLGGLPTIAWVGIGVVLVVAIATIALLLRRRPPTSAGRTAPPAAPPSAPTQPAPPPPAGETDEGGVTIYGGGKSPGAP
ncbi:MAG: InlB B-repeat-containing protein [Thermoplasmata archaeon]